MGESQKQMQVKNERCNMLFSAFGIFMKPGFVSFLDQFDKPGIYNGACVAAGFETRKHKSCQMKVSAKEPVGVKSTRTQK